jgi:hypothetical protein
MTHVPIATVKLKPLPPRVALDNGLGTREISKRTRILQLRVPRLKRCPCPRRQRNQLGTSPMFNMMFAV